MPYRKRGALIPLERAILEVAVRRSPEGIYGFALAQDLAEPDGASGLVSHGTLYKALDRLRREGLLTAEWEDAESAAEEGRPRRRVYALTTAGERALQPALAPSPRPGRATG